MIFKSKNPRFTIKTPLYSSLANHTTSIASGWWHLFVGPKTQPKIKRLILSKFKNLLLTNVR